MSRAVAALGVVDTLLSGISLLGGEQTWLVAILLTLFTLLSPIVVMVASMVSEAFECPAVMAPDECLASQ